MTRIGIYLNFKRFNFIPSQTVALQTAPPHHQNGQLIIAYF